MARYYYSGARDIVEQTKKIELSWLRKHNYIGGLKVGNLSWTYNGNPSGKINVQVNTDPYNPNIKFDYKIQKNGEIEWTNMNFSFSMESLPCRFGGEKWFFICGLSKNGQYCGRRVRILYQAGNYFGCRHCADLSYESCNISGFQKRFGKIISIPDLEEMEAKIKRTYYRGKFTKKYLRFLRMSDRFENEFIGMAMSLEKRAGKIVGKK